MKPLAAIVLGIATLTATGACGDSNSPGSTGTYFRATLNGASWVPDTATAVFFGVSPDSGTLVIVGSRTISGEDQTIAVAIRDFPRLGGVTLSDSSGPGTGVYSVIHSNSGLPPATTNFFSTLQQPGIAHLSAHNASSSTITGDFSFRAVTTPDTLPHLTIAGTFRVQYSFQQVYPLARQPANHRPATR